MEKKAARIKAIEIRNQIKDQKIRSEKAIDTLISSHILDDIRTIGIYFPIRNEMDIISLIEHYPDKRFFLPVTNAEISFCEYNKGCYLEEGKFKTREPKGLPVVTRDSIEAFIIPCVAVNNEDFRLGYGKGYYDRYLEGYKGLKIGLINKELSSFDFKSEEHDLKLDYVIKEWVYV